MEVYYYCSYTGSPVGFILGRLDYEPQKSGNYELEQEHISLAVRKCFDLGSVRKAFGVLPGESQSRYFLLTKKLTAKEALNGELLNYSLGIALVTDNAEEFRLWMRKQEGSEQEIAEAIKKSIVLDRMNDYGFTVCAKQLADLLQKSFRPLFANCGTNLDKLDLEKTYFMLASSRTDLNQLQQDLSLSDQEKELWISSRDTKLACYGKKKRPPLLPIAISLIAAASILMVVVYLLGKKDKSSGNYRFPPKGGATYSVLCAKPGLADESLEKPQSQRENLTEAAYMDVLSTPNAIFHVMADGQPTGPFDLAALSKMVLMGTLSENSLVWKPDLENWAAAKDMSELQTLFAQDPMVPPEIHS